MKKIASFFLSLLLLACKGESEPVEPVDERIAVLASKEWRIVKYEYVIDGVTQDERTYIQNCEKDDSILFKEDGTFIYKPNAVKCNYPSGDPSAYSGTWSLVNNTFKISKWGEFGEAVYEVKELTATKFEIYLSNNVPHPAGGTYPLTHTIIFN